jgi:hypothetical protein
MHQVNSIVDEIIPARRPSIVDRDLISRGLQAASFGLILPHIIFVNDLGHPLQTGFLLALFAVGRLGGSFVFRRQQSADFALTLQGVLLALSYLIIALSAVWTPTGIVAVRMAQATWLLVGFFGSNLLFGDLNSERRHSFTRSQIWLIGISIGALASGLLTWGLGRSGERYDTSEMFLPAIGAVICSAISSVLRPNTVLSENTPRRANSQNLISIALCALTASSLAMACTVTCMMMWETFSFPPSWVALTIGNVGLLALAVQWFVARALRGNGSVLLVMLIMGVGLIFMGVSAATLMWGPNTDSGMIVFSGLVMIGVGWGFWLAAWIRFDSKTSSETSDRVWTVAWIVGPICSAGLFYDHERTSFGLGGVVVALAIILFLGLLRTHFIRRDDHAVAGSATAEPIRGGLA